MMDRASERREELSSFNDEELRTYSEYRNFIVEDQYDDGEDEDVIYGESGNARKIAWAMNQLSPEYSDLLMRFYYYKFSIDRISEDLGLDKKTVYVKKSRALKRLKEIYLSANESDFETWGENN